MTEKWLKSTVKQDKSAVEMLKNFRVTLQRMVCPFFPQKLFQSRKLLATFFVLQNIKYTMYGQVSFFSGTSKS